MLEQGGSEARSSRGLGPFQTFQIYPSGTDRSLAIAFFQLQREAFDLFLPIVLATEVRNRRFESAVLPAAGLRVHTDRKSGTIPIVRLFRS